MLTFLFWNLHRNSNLIDSIVRLANLYQIDIFVFAECTTKPIDIISALNPIGHQAQYRYAAGRIPSRIEIFIRFDREFIESLSDDSRYTIRQVSLPAKDPFILAAAHLLSPLRSEGYDRERGTRSFAGDIQRVERDQGHDRTVVLGDLNLNPFDSGVVAADSLHAVSSKSVARRVRRTVQRQQYPIFYNPMWSQFGRYPDGPYGTYYYDQSGQVCYFWHIFDQVLIRPSLLDNWEDSELHILTTDGVHSFLTADGIPDKNNISDHLPILFRLNL